MPENFYIIIKGSCHVFLPKSEERIKEEAKEKEFIKKVKTT